MKPWMGISVAGLLLLAGCGDDGSNRPDPLVTPEFLGTLGETVPGALYRPRDVAVDPSGRIYVLNSSSPDVQLFGPEGQSLGGFDLPFYPRSLVARGDELFLIASYRSTEVQVVSPEGVFLRSFGEPGDGPGQLRSPADIDRAPDGSFFVLDYARRRILHFTPGGEFLGEWGERGEEDGEFERPVNMAISPAGELAVYDDELRRFQRFAADGRFLGGWPLPGAMTAATYDYGYRLVFDGNDRLGVVGESSDGTTSSIFFLGPDGAVLETFGLPASRVGRNNFSLARSPDGSFILGSGGMSRVFSVSPDGQIEGEFGHPFGSLAGEFQSVSSLAVTAEGDIWVSDSYARKIVRFSPDGQVLQTIECLMDEGPYDDCVRPRGLAAAPGGGLYVETENYYPEILRLDSAGRIVSRWAPPVTGGFEVRQMFVDPMGTLYVLAIEECNFDTGCRERIWQFSPDGAVEAVFPLDRPGDEAESLPWYTAIALDRSGRLWAWNGQAMQFEVFRPGFELDRVIPGATTGPAPIRSVSAFAIQRNGDLFVDDSDRGRIVWLTPQGIFIDRLPYPSEYITGGYSDARDIEVGPEWRVYAIKGSRVLIYGPPEVGSVGLSRP